MNLKIGYYPVLDMLLGLRQLYAVERFQPFGEVMKNIEQRMDKNEKDLLNEIGDKTNGWLEIIEVFINLTGIGMSGPEELLIALDRDNRLNNYTNLSPGEKKELSLFLRNMWIKFFSSEIAKNSKRTFEKAVEISQRIDESRLWEYLITTSDRIRRVNEDELEILIKPVHKFNVTRLDSVYVMPSVFATRKLTFWNNSTDYIFYISSELEKKEDEEPSDMLLLKTLALNDKTRLKMLRILSSGNYSVGDIAEKLNINSSTASRHFKVFKDAGFVDVFSQEGNTVYYSINKNEIKRSLNMILKYVGLEEGQQ